MTQSNFLDQVDPQIQPWVSNFIADQFPDLYHQYGPVLIAFMRAYFQWMEEQGPLFYARRYALNRDIDTTVDDFLIHFKKTYLQNIQLQTASDIRNLVKHSLDLYRAKGTPRAIDLLFRLVFGIGAHVYYPSTDMFRLSDGKWRIPTYLEVTLREDHGRFVGQQVVGLTSGATAFVERVVRVKDPFGKLIDVLYISALMGNFVTGEIINTTSVPFDIASCPYVIGSLTSLQIVSGGANFTVGQLVDLTGSAGYGGIGRVASVSTVSGAANFELEYGGYGYTSNAQVLISSQVYTLINVVPASWPAISRRHSYFKLFEPVSQYLGTINYTNANGTFSNSEIITTYYPNNSVMGTAVILASPTVVNSTAGNLSICVLSGNISANAFFSPANSVGANQNILTGFISGTLTANIESETDHGFLLLANISTPFIVGETCYQFVSPNTTVSATVTAYTGTGLTGNLSFANCVGVFDPNRPVFGAISSATAGHINAISISIATLNNPGFIVDTRAPIVANSVGNTSAGSNTTGAIAFFGTGTGASFAVGPLTFPETVTIGTDLFLPYANVALNATAYGFPANPSGNLSSTFASCMTTQNVVIGQVGSIQSINPGTGYPSDPGARILEPVTFAYRRKGWYLTLAGPPTSAFVIGELVTQGSARGLVTVSNSSAVVLHRLSLFGEFVVTTNVATQVIGKSSGATANVQYVDRNDNPGDVDEDGEFIGVDAIISANVSLSAGSAADIEIESSGFGYFPQELIRFTSQTNAAQFGTAVAVLNKQGVGQGYYFQDGGFLSGPKKLRDGLYYQEFSYEVRASITLNQYESMLRNVLHTAGTKAFGAFYHESLANVEFFPESVVITPVTGIVPTPASAATGMAGLIFTKVVDVMAGAVANDAAGTPVTNILHGTGLISGTGSPTHGIGNLPGAAETTGPGTFTANSPIVSVPDAGVAMTTTAAADFEAAHGVAMISNTGLPSHGVTDAGGQANTKSGAPFIEKAVAASTLAVTNAAPGNTTPLGGGHANGAAGNATVSFS